MVSYILLLHLNWLVARVQLLIFYSQTLLLPVRTRPRYVKSRCCFSPSANSIKNKQTTTTKHQQNNTQAEEKGVKCDASVHKKKPKQKGQKKTSLCVLAGVGA